MRSYEEERARAEARAKRVAEKNELQEIRHKNDKKKVSTSKLITGYLFVVLNVILVYALVVMYQFRDLTYLGALIADIAGQVITYFIYSKKSQAENTVGGITYELAMKKQGREQSKEERMDEMLREMTDGDFPSMDEEAVG